jgi:hypothetical protein
MRTWTSHHDPPTDEYGCWWNQGRRSGGTVIGVTEPTGVYPPWPAPAPKRRRFVWWEALPGVVAPTLLGLLLWDTVGFGLALGAMLVLTVTVCVAAAVKGRWTLLVAVITGLILMVAGLVGVAAFSLFSASTALR